MFLVSLAAFAFIPAWRDVELGGMAVFGWLVAALMLVSPAVTLCVFARRRGAERARADRAESNHAEASRGNCPR